MRMRSGRLIAVLACAGFACATVIAHEEGHDEEESKLMPSTCAHLADAARYVTDVAYPQVKTLKTQCDAERKKATEKSDRKPAETPAAK
jgi:hypothetical protein